MENRPQVRFLDRTTPPHLITLILLASSSAMAMNMFLPSLPSMTAYFNTDYRLMQLSIAVFLGMNAVLQLFIGPVSDRYGRRPVLLVGYALFILATFGCIFSPTAEIFLAFRMGQAAIVVSMVMSRAIVRDMFEQDQAASMIGYVTMGMAVVPMLTPALGGYFDEHFGWQANFWFFIVVGTAIALLIWADAGETNRSKSVSFGAQFADYPELFGSPRFWGYSLAAAFASGAFFAYLGGAPFVGTEVFGMSASALGLFFGAPAVGYIIGNGITARTAHKVGINTLILAGSLIATAGSSLSLIVFYAGYGTATSFFGFMVLIGLGNGLVLPSSTAGILSVRPKLAGTASGLGGALMIGGGALLSALAGSLLTPANGPFALLWIMLIVTLLGVFCIVLVIRRDRRIKLAR